jgi:hypothetical protein
LAKLVGGILQGHAEVEGSREGSRKKNLRKGDWGDFFCRG